MTSLPGPVRPPGAAELLERALVYSRGALAGVRPEHLALPTPCPGWSLAQLLRHMDDSLAAMADAASAPHLSLAPASSPTEAADLLASVRRRACTLVGRWAAADGGTVGLGGLVVEREAIGRVGALEITLHGWDVAQACGRALPLPPVLAMDLWPVARDHLGAADLPCRAGAELQVADSATPQERLLGLSGRRG